MKKVSITHMSNAHNDWLRALDFYKQEIDILKGRLTEIAGRNTGHEAASKIEHFENQFKVQRDNIDRLSHDTRLNVALAGKEAEASSAGYIDPAIVTQHKILHEKYKQEEKAINDLRHEFTEFAVEWM